MTIKWPLIISEEIKDALNEKRGVVALESTVIAHGLPYPKNKETTLKMMKAIRDEGAVPALIAIVDGNLFVGSSSVVLERLIDNKSKVLKVSSRDIAYCLATKSIGATTVSATMNIASLAGIRIFATGGIGGVHRGSEQTMDISADIIELSKTPVAVVCAGAKSILDIAKTLEMLETNGVPVIGYLVDYFPEFYCIGDQYHLDTRCDDIGLIKAMIDMHMGLKKSGMIIANSIDENNALPKAVIENALDEALKDAFNNKIQGKELTPFLLKNIALITQEKSVDCNCALLESNARLAARIAVK